MVDDRRILLLNSVLASTSAMSGWERRIGNCPFDIWVVDNLKKLQGMAETVGGPRPILNFKEFDGKERVNLIH